MSRAKIRTIRAVCSLVLVASTIGLVVPVVHAADGRVPERLAITTSAAVRRVHLTKLPHHYRSPLAGEGSATGLGQALLIEALIGIIGIGATIVFVNHRRRQHHVRPL